MQSSLEEPNKGDQLFYTSDRNFLDYKQYLNLVDLEDGTDDENDEIGTEESPYTSNASSSDYLDQRGSSASHSDSNSGNDNLSMDEFTGDEKMRARLVSNQSRMLVTRSVDESTYRHFATNSLRGSSTMLQTAAGTCIQGASQALMALKKSQTLASKQRA